MTRREMREHCFKILFCALFYPPEEAALQIEQYFQSPQEEIETSKDNTEILHLVKLEPADEEFLEERVNTILAKIPEIDVTIDSVAEGWRTKRMGKVELTILRQAIYEMFYDDHVPQKVAINEAVDLAKKFGGSDSSAFINGILAKIVTVV